MHDLCPRCGTERIGAFRFCRYCRLDFDAPGAGTPAPPSGRSPSTGVAGHALNLAARRSGPAGGLLALVFAVVVGVAGLSTEVMPSLGSRASAIPTADPTPQSSLQVEEAPAATPPPTPAATATPGAGPNGKTTRAKVVRVIDGDTILVAFGGKRYEVRYLGLSTPATVRRRAMAANAALVAGRTVVLEADGSEADRSGRLLRYVWLEQGPRWTLVNLELVRRGFATVATRSPRSKYADRYIAAERHARARHLGFWDHGPKAKPKPRATPKPPGPQRP